MIRTQSEARIHKSTATLCKPMYSEKFKNNLALSHNRYQITDKSVICSKKAQNLKNLIFKKGKGGRNSKEIILI